jgi:hypothetical protein
VKIVDYFNIKGRGIVVQLVPDCDGEPPIRDQVRIGYELGIYGHRIGTVSGLEWTEHSDVVGVILRNPDIDWAGKGDKVRVMNPDIFLWEILVPTTRNDGRPIRTRFHRVWDEKVRAITGGLTITPPVKGQWVSMTDEDLYIERMIPVRIMCSEAHIMDIVKMTKD